MPITRPLAAVTAFALAAATLFAGSAAIASGPPSNTPTFEPEVHLIADTSGVATGDINGDGLNDIVTYNSNNTVTIFTNQLGSPGTFVASAPVAVADCTYFSFDIGPAGFGILCSNDWFLLLDNTGAELARDAVPVDPFSFEGNPDLVEPTTVNDLPGFAVGYRDAGEGVVASFTWAGSTLSRLDMAAPAPITFGFNMYLDLKALEVDGVPSVAWAVYSQGILQPTAVIYVPTNDSYAPITVLQDDLLTPGSPGIAVGDFNADGLDDVVVAGYPGFTALHYVLNLQQPGGTFTVTPSEAFGNHSVPGIAAAPSFAGSCYSDIVVTAEQDGTTNYYTNDGELVFATTSAITAGTTTTMIDLDGDQRADRLARAFFGAVAYQLQNDLSPVFSIQPAEIATAGNGQEVTFTVATDPVPAVVQWQVAPAGTDEWTDIPGATAASYSFTATTADEGNLYRALVTTDGGYAALSCPAALVDVVPAGGFTVTKDVTGAAADSVDPTTAYLVDYTVNGVPQPQEQLLDGQFFQINGIPDGQEVVITEVQPADTSTIDFGAPVYLEDGDPGDGVFDVTADTTVAVVIQNPASLVPGSFQITKKVNGVDGQEGTPFQVGVTIGTSGETFHFISENAPYTSGPIDVGTTVSVRELPPAIPLPDGWTWSRSITDLEGDTAFGDDPVSFTITSPGQTVQTVAVSNTAVPPGGFVLSKAVTGTGAALVPSDRTYEVKYLINGFETTRTFTVATPIVISDLPDGTAVTIIETPLVDTVQYDWSIPSFTWDGNTAPIAVFTVSSGSSVNIMLTNEAVANEGRVSIEKLLSGVDFNQLDPGTEFTFSVSIGNAAPIPAVVNAGSNWTWLSEPIIAGTEVFVTEVAPSDATLPAGYQWVGDVGYTGGTLQNAGVLLTVGEDETASVTATNEAAEFGAFTVGKTVTGSSAARAAVGQYVFSVHYSYTGSDGPVQGDLSLTDGGSNGLIDIPAGTVVTLTENPRTVSGVEFGDPVWSGSGVADNQDGSATITIGTGTTLAVVLENPARLLAGAFEVTKTVTGTGTAAVGDYEFVVDYEYTLGDQLITGSLSLSDGETDGLADLPQGTVVTLTEATPSVPGVDFGEPVWSGPDVLPTGGGVQITIVDQTTLEVGLENPARLMVGSFEVTKTVTGGGAGQVPAGYEFRINYSYQSGNETIEGTLLLSKANPTDGLDNLPAGTVVTLTESTPAVGGVLFGAPAWSGDANVSVGVVTVTIGDLEIQSVSLENPAILPAPMPVTGADVLWIVIVAAVLLGLGAVAVVVPALRRRS